MNTVLKLSIVLAVMVFITSCSMNKDLMGIDTGINIKRGRIAEDISTHGGFHGDGRRYAEVVFSESDIENIEHQIEKNRDWKELPYDDVMEVLANGDDFHSRFIKLDDEGDCYVFPEINRGYYYFKNRQKDSEGSFLDSSSFNFTAALFDAERGVLYYFDLDT